MYTSKPLWFWCARIDSDRHFIAPLFAKVHRWKFQTLEAVCRNFKYMGTCRKPYFPIPGRELVHLTDLPITIKPQKWDLRMD